MDKRRALLMGAEKGLYIYKPGFTEWKNIESKTQSGSVTTTFNAGAVDVVAGTTSTTLKINLLISEDTYGKYSTLVFKASHTGGSGSSKITWQNVASSSVKKETVIAASVTEYFVDISGSTGDYYISIAPYLKNRVLSIYDIHFE
jgi:hypothetical protein